MSIVRAYDQVNASTVQVGLSALPAASTILRARLAVVTSIESNNVGVGFQFAPPNTLLGISWLAGGTAPELITTSNWKDGSWYVAGPGELTVHDRWAIANTTVSPTQFILIYNYASVLDLETPLFSTAAMSPGISINVLGGGFYNSAIVWLTYDLTVWYDLRAIIGAVPPLGR